ncbi:hypothetical protein OH76DRAFT_1480407 [Lentinus brumalis]|uniref:Uncharacterized protein n=1 Tax=Lentinus brumalis TaxID=2498619 RepID=A0A371DJU5_9APHY|nr:hypothetical protein OH76DRAFT_1480407 [Polyporus brumalis]
MRNIQHCGSVTHIAFVWKNTTGNNQFRQDHRHAWLKIVRNHPSTPIYLFTSAAFVPRITADGTLDHVVDDWSGLDTCWLAELYIDISRYAYNIRLLALPGTRIIPDTSSVSAYYVAGTCFRHNAHPDPAGKRTKSPIGPPIDHHSPDGGLGKSGERLDLITLTLAIVHVRSQRIVHDRTLSSFDQDHAEAATTYVEIINDMIDKAPTVIIAEPDAIFRHKLLSSLHERLDKHLAQANDVRSLFIAVKDNASEPDEDLHSFLIFDANAN